MELETERLILRPMVPEDIDFLYKINTNKEILKYCGDPEVYKYDDMLAWLYSIQETENMEYIVIEKSTNEPIGYCGLTKSHDSYDLSYILDIPYWNKGYATEIAKELILHAKDIGIKRISARRDRRNEASGHVLEKFGFKQIGIGFMLSENGQNMINIVEYQLDIG